MWNEEAIEAFIKLKKSVTKLPILRFLEFFKSFTIEYDAFAASLFLFIARL